MKYKIFLIRRFSDHNPRESRQNSSSSQTNLIRIHQITRGLIRTPLQTCHTQLARFLLSLIKAIAKNVCYPCQSH